MAGVVLLAGTLAADVANIAEVDLADPELFRSRQHQLAYALNAYAALVIEEVADREGATGLPHLRADPFPWLRHRIGGRRMDLARFRDVIVRTFADPRVHVALACGAVSCPVGQVYEPETVEMQLDVAARRFVDDPDHVRIGEGEILLSKIFKWYGKDFGRQGVLTWIAGYRTEPLQLDAEIRWLPWDRTLSVPER